MVVSGILDSILVAVFCIVVVFGVLCMLWGAIRIFSSVILRIEKNNNKSSLKTSV